MNTLNKPTLAELKTAYGVISSIMEENHLTKDNSFLRVKNWISNTLCDRLVEMEKTDEPNIFK